MAKKAVSKKAPGRISELERLNDELLRSTALARERNHGEHLSKVRALIGVSMEVMAENTVDGALQRLADGAREVTEGNFAASAYGYGEGTFKAGAESRADQVPGCAPVTVCDGLQGGFLMSAIEGIESIRLGDEDLRSHPLWGSVPTERWPLRGLLVARLVGLENKTNGMVLVSDKDSGDFTLEDELLLVQLAAFASLAIQHIEARLDSEQKTMETDTVFSTLTDAVVVVDESGRAVKSNPASRAAYGFDPAGMNAASVAERIRLSHLDGKEVALEEWPVNQALVGHTVIKERLLLQDAEGRLSFVAATACPLILEGKLSGGVQVMQNVTEEETLLRRLYETRESLEVRVKERTEELERANRELGKTKALLEKTFEALDQAVLIIDPSDRRILSCNRAVELIFGYTQDELVGQSTELLHASKEEYVQFRKKLFAALDRGGIYRGECRRRRKDGSIFASEHSVSEIMDEEGKRHAVVSVLRDISERKKMEEKILDYMSRLESSNVELQNFAFVASHDLQEPLRKIQTFGNMLETKFAPRLGEDGRDYVRRMGNAAGRMQSLIKGLLSYSRVATAGLPLAPVNLSDVIRDVLSDLEVRVNKMGVQVEVGELPTVEADAVQMEQLFQNLIGNSLKFGEARKGLVVRISSEAAGDGEASARIMVQDNGVGFDMKFADRIFQPFERLHGRSAYEGVGMGLAICRKIVERHQGTITADAAPGEGATFVVTLPLKQPAIRSR